jgi:hypothetical protein
MPMRPDDIYDTFVFGAPDEDLTAWELSYAVIEESLKRIDPNAKVDHKSSPPRNSEYLWFQANFPFGWAEGGARVLPHNSVSIANATVDKAAHFAAWLRHDIVPPGVEIFFNVFEGIEVGMPPGVLPDTIDVGEIKATLKEYVRGITSG